MDDFGATRTDPEQELANPELADEGQRTLLSEDEVGALFEAVQPDLEEVEEEVGASLIPRPFEPRTLTASDINLEDMIPRVHAMAAVQGGAVLGGILRSTVSFEIGPHAARLETELHLTGCDVSIEVACARASSFAIIRVPDEAARAMADRQLGGPGIPSAPGRPMTDLEKRVTERPLAGLARCIAEAWSPWLNAPPETAVVFGDLSRPRDREVLVAPFRLGINSRFTEGAIIYVRTALASALLSEDRGGGSHRTLRDQLDSVPLRVGMRCPGFALRLRELLDLRRGQALLLGRSNELPIDVTVEDRVMYRGHLEVDKAGGARHIHLDEHVGRGRPRAAGTQPATERGKETGKDQVANPTGARKPPSK